MKRGSRPCLSILFLSIGVGNSAFYHIPMYQKYKKAVYWDTEPDVLQYTIEGRVILNPNYYVELVLNKYPLQIIYLPFRYNNKEVILLP